MNPAEGAESRDPLRPRPANTDSVDQANLNSESLLVPTDFAALGASHLSDSIEQMPQHGEIPLVQLFKNLRAEIQPDPVIRRQCALKLEGLGKEDVTVVSGFIAETLPLESNSKVRLALLNALASYGSNASRALPAIEPSLGSKDGAERLAAMRAFKSLGGSLETVTECALQEFSRRDGIKSPALEMLAACAYKNAQVPRLLERLFKKEMEHLEFEFKKLQVLDAYLSVAPLEILKIAPTVIKSLYATMQTHDEHPQKRDNIVVQRSPLCEESRRILVRFVIAALENPQEFRASFTETRDFGGVVALLYGGREQERKAGLKLAGELLAGTQFPTRLLSAVLHNFNYGDFNVAASAGRVLAECGPEGLKRAVACLNRNNSIPANITVAALATVVECQALLRGECFEMAESVTKACHRILLETGPEQHAVLIQTLKALRACGKYAEPLSSDLCDIASGKCVGGRIADLQIQALRALAEIRSYSNCDRIAAILGDRNNSVGVRIEAATALGDHGYKASSNARALNYIVKNSNENDALKRSCAQALEKITKKE